MDSVDLLKVRIIRLRNELAWITDENCHGGPNRKDQRAAILAEIGDLQQDLEKVKSNQAAPIDAR
jgi:hypothetical protein